jgi:GNAT-family acetyltransferase (TIGR03103 family)
MGSTTHIRRDPGRHPDPSSAPSLCNWQSPRGPNARQMKDDAYVEMGWGKLIFAHTFSDNARVVELLLREQKRQRDIALYLRDPHVILSLAPDRLFLDPSHTYRLRAHAYRQAGPRHEGFVIRRILNREDADAVNAIYKARHMVTADADFLLDGHATRLRTCFVAESLEEGRIVGTVTGVDHHESFNDPENGASLWCLAVDPQCHLSGVGHALVRQLIEHYLARGRQYVDLSVMHDNAEAIALYEKLGFQRVPVFCVKRKNPINEPLFTPTPVGQTQLNPYATIIVDEARRRGIHVEVLDAEAGYFRLERGARSIVCRESLTELTSAIAMSRCDDKRVTRRLLAKAGVRVPAQRAAGSAAGNAAFLAEYVSVVVKPARGEQGVGISVDLRSPDDVEAAIRFAREHCEDVVLEQFVPGEDLRVIVIGYEVVAAAVRRPPMIAGTGRHTLRQLIEKYSRRRMAATGGESRVPLDEQTRQCVALAGYDLDDTLAAGERITVRRTANLHTGGTIHDVTADLHPALADAAVTAARALDIPVTGLDFIVPDVAGPEYVVIEANERPGLANHEPQPTAEKFIDLLFPHSRL